jgi:hypothetical protein
VESHRRWAVTHDIGTRDAIIEELSGQIIMANEVRLAHEKEIGRLRTLALEFHTLRVKELEAEVERLKAQPTAAQERAEIVNYIINTQRLRPMDDARSICHRLATKIMIGEHWPTEGKP